MNMCNLPWVNFSQAPQGGKNLTQLKLFWERMGMLRQWVLGSIFATWFQREEGLISHFISFKMSRISDLLNNATWLLIN